MLSWIRCRSTSLTAPSLSKGCPGGNDDDRTSESAAADVAEESVETRLPRRAAGPPLDADGRADERLQPAVPRLPDRRGLAEPAAARDDAGGVRRPPRPGARPARISAARHALQLRRAVPLQGPPRGWSATRPTAGWRPSRAPTASSSTPRGSPTEVVASGLTELLVCLDGADQETISRYRKNADFEEILNGIRRVLAGAREGRERDAPRRVAVHRHEA